MFRLPVLSFFELLINAINRISGDIMLSTGQLKHRMDYIVQISKRRKAQAMFEPANIEPLHIRVSNRLDRSFSPLILYMLVIKINVPDQRCFRNLAFHRNIFLPKRIDCFRFLRHCFCAPVGNPVLHVTQAFRIRIPFGRLIFREQLPVGYAFANPILIRISEGIAAVSDLSFSGQKQTSLIISSFPCHLSTSRFSVVITKQLNLIIQIFFKHFSFEEYPSAVPDQILGILVLCNDLSKPSRTDVEVFSCFG